MRLSATANHPISTPAGGAMWRKLVLPVQSRSFPCPWMPPRSSG
jgi:hypothetical protein